MNAVPGTAGSPTKLIRSFVWNRWMWALLILTVVLLFYIGARWRMDQIRKTALHYWARELSSVTDVTRMSIDNWLRERRGHVTEISEYLGRHPEMFRETVPGISESRREQVRAGIQEDLTSIRAHNDYAGLWVLNPQGQEVVSWEGASAPSHDGVTAALEAIRSKVVQIRGPSLDEKKRLILAFAAPIFGRAEKSSPVVGAVLMTLDPTQTLFPLITSENSPDRSEEYMLVARSADLFVVLSPLKNPPLPPLAIQSPWKNAPAVERQAILGPDGFIAGRDFRGVPVLAVTRYISGSVGLVRKIDQDEAFASYRAQVRMEGLLAMAVIVVMGLAVFSYRRVERAARLREVAASEAKLSGIIKSAMDAIVTVDLNQQITLFNAAAERMFGYTSEEILGKPVDVLIPPRLRNAHRNHIEEFGRSGETARRMPSKPNLLGVRSNGEEFHIEASISQLELEGQKIYSAMIRDISPRKHAEELLRQTEEKYRVLFEESKDVVFFSTPDGKLLDINPAGVELFGYSSKEELLRKDIARDLYFDPHDREGDTRAHEARGYVKDYELSLRRKDGKKVVVLETSVAVRDSEGRIVGHRGILRDVTERRALERQFLQAQKMEAVGQMAGGIAHDFNNILTAISGYAGLLQGSLPSDSPHLKGVGEIVRASERAASLIRQLLAFSRRQFMQPKVLDLNMVVADMDGMLRRLIGEHISLTTTLAADLEAVKADPSQIEQVIMNLVVNARDAMPSGGRVVIETHNVTLDEKFVNDHMGSQVGPFVKLLVTDTGGGMEPEVISHIFEPFFTTKGMGRGTGLGLSTVYGIVKQSGGYISVESVLGEGSTFSIYLPREPKPEAITTVPEREYRDLYQGTETILLVEDEEVVRSLGREILVMNGYTVLEAANGEQAVKMARSYPQKIHLLVTDVVMPGMNGHEVARDLSSILSDLRVLYVSGYTGEDMIQRGIIESGVAFLQKPYTPAQFARKVREVLEAVTAK